MSTIAKVTVRVIASPETWIESEAVRQLEETARLPGMRAAFGMPDLHPGRGNPIGAAFAADGFVYPHLVGGDIGCGMALFDVDIVRRKAKRDKLVAKMGDLEGPWDGDTAAWLEARGVATTAYDMALGTIGGGNHFAEIQAVEEVLDATAFAALGLDATRLVLLVHSGSRGLGESILRRHTSVFGARGLAETSTEAAQYLAAHDHAVRWGEANRALVAARAAGSLGVDVRRVVDVCHNRVAKREVGGCPCLLHRKGAAPADEGPLVIPGSRGAWSYLVVPVGDGEVNGHSLAHGAGRKWSRSDARGKLGDRFRAEDLTRTELGSAVICDDKDLLFEEAPQAYKNIDTVVDALVREGVVRLVARLRPLVTYKTRSRRA